MWAEGTRGRIIGAASFLTLVYSAFEYASKAELIDLSNPIVWRWRVLFMLAGILVGLALAPLISMGAAIAGVGYAGVGACVIWILMAAAHWANTGEITNSPNSFYFSYLFTLPFFTIFFIWLLGRQFSSGQKSVKEMVVVASPASPLLSTFCSILSFISGVVITRAKLGEPWPTFFGYYHW